MKKYPLGIIGANGTVGKTLVEQYQSKGMNPILINRENFEKNSKNFFNLLIITCFDARKYIVDKDPISDLSHINYVFKFLKKYQVNKAILISTVDVYPDKKGDENTNLSFEKYGYSFNRYICEIYAKSIFKNLSIIRLQALVGKNIKKNYLFDLRNNNCVTSINQKLEVQYYPLERLLLDLQTIEDNNIKLLNLSAEPLSISEIKKKLLIPNEKFLQQQDNQCLNNYCVKSLYWNNSASGSNGFWVCKNEIIYNIAKYFGLT